MTATKYIHGERAALFEIVKGNPEVKLKELRAIFPQVHHSSIEDWCYMARVEYGYAQPNPHRKVVRTCPLCGKKVLERYYCWTCRAKPNFNAKRQEYLRTRAASRKRPSRKRTP